MLHENISLLNVEEKEACTQKCPHSVTPQCPLCTASSWNVFYFILKMCLQRLTDGFKKKNMSTFWAVCQLNRLSLSKTLCLILSPSCLRFYVFRSSFTRFYQRHHFRSFYRTLCTSDGQKRATVTKLPVMLPHLHSPVATSVVFCPIALQWTCLDNPQL